MRNPSYDPGELDQRISILRAVKVGDGYGGQETVTETTVATLWAKVKAGNPAERYDFDQVYNTEVATFVIRNRQDLLESDVILYRGTRYNIRALPALTPRYRYLEIQAESGVGD